MKINEFYTRGLPEHLDWHTITCQCEHHKPNGCKSEATHVVAIHALHRCKDPGLDPDGNRVEIRCYHCVVQLWVRIADRLDRVAPLLRALMECGSCGAPVTDISDVIRSIETLK